MSTVNISLPEEQVRFIDRLVSRYKFANRSEFIRAIIRMISFRPEIIGESITYPFSAPSEKSASKIVNGFKSSGKYSKAFLKDLEEGLKASDYFSK